MEFNLFLSKNVKNVKNVKYDKRIHVSIKETEKLQGVTVECGCGCIQRCISESGSIRNGEL